MFVAAGHLYEYNTQKGYSSMTTREPHIASGEQLPQRVDRWLAEQLPEKTREQWRKKILLGEVMVDGAKVKPSFVIHEGQAVTVRPDTEADSKETHVAYSGPEIPIIYDDENVLVINKPAGIAVHAGEKQPFNATVVACFYGQLTPSEDSRPGVVHRLDKDTSGVMILARNPHTEEFLKQQFKKRQVEKIYDALVWGNLAQPKARIELPIARHHDEPTKMVVTSEGKQAVSEYEVVEQLPQYSLLKVRLLTGRMHQIRVHLNYLGHPVVGDKTYGRKPMPAGLTRQFLHAHSLGLVLPGGEKRTFTADLPPELNNFLAQQRNV